MSVPGPWRWLREPARLHTSPVARAGISRMAIAGRIGDREQTPVSPPTTRQAIPWMQAQGLRRLALGGTAGAAGYGSRRGGGFGAESKCECWLGGFRGGCVGP
jgi:hypothetical protein